MTLDREEINDIYETHVDLLEVDERGLPKEKKVTSFTESQKYLLIALAIGFYYVVIYKKAVDMNIGIILTAIAVFIIYNSNKVDNAIKEPIPDKVAKAILQKELEWKQRITGEIPRGDIRVGPPSKLRYLDGKAWKWEIYFEIDKQNGGLDMYTAELHPFNGRLIGIKERAEGWTGREPADIKYIRRREDVWQQKYFNKPIRPGETPPPQQPR